MISKFIQAIRIPHREDTLFGLLFLTIFFVPLFFLPLLPDAFDFPKFAAFLIAMGMCFFVLAFRKAFDIRIHPWLNFGLVVFAILNIVAATGSQSILTSIIGDHQRHANSLLFTLNWIFFIYIISCINTTDKTLTLFRVLSISGFLVAVLGILHSFSIGYYTGLIPEARPVTPGFIGNQNFSAMFLVGIIPLLLPLVDSAKNNIIKILYASAGFIMLWALMIFASRGSIIAIFVAGVIGVILLFLKNFSWIIRTGVTASILIAIVLASLFYTSNRGVESSLQLQTDAGIVSRMNLWVQSIELIKANPFIGVGQGNFQNAFKRVSDASLVEIFNDAHNLFINVAATTGIPAFLILVFIFALVLLVSFRNFWLNNSLLSWAIFVGLIALLISCFFNPVSIPIWILLGVLIGCSQFFIQPITYSDVQLSLKYGLITLGAIFIITGSAFMASEFIAKFATDAYRVGRYDISKKYAAYALSLNPFYSYPHSIIAATMIKQNEEPNLIRNEISQIVSHQESSDLYFVAAKTSLMLYERTNDYGDARRMLDFMNLQQKAYPNRVNQLVDAAYYAYRVKDYDNAITYLHYAISLDSQRKYSYTYLLLAEVYLKQGKLDQMITALQSANEIETNPGYQVIFDDYKNGKFTATSLPIYFPAIEL